MTENTWSKRDEKYNVIGCGIALLSIPVMGAFLAFFFAYLFGWLS